MPKNKIMKENMNIMTIQETKCDQDKMILNAKKQRDVKQLPSMWMDFREFINPLEPFTSDTLGYYRNKYNSLNKILRN